jgi:hypothetical protein
VKTVNVEVLFVVTVTAGIDVVVATRFVELVVVGVVIVEIWVVEVCVKKVVLAQEVEMLVQVVHALVQVVVVDMLVEVTVVTASTCCALFGFIPPKKMVESSMSATTKDPGPNLASTPNPPPVRNPYEDFLSHAIGASSH